MNYNLRTSKIYKAVIFSRLFPLGLLRFFRISILGVGLVSAVAYGVTSAYLDNLASEGLLFGVFLTSFSLGLSLLFFEIYNYYYLRYPDIVQTDNLADLLNFSSAKIMDRAERFSRLKNDGGVSARSILIALLDDKSLDEVFVRIPELFEFKKVLKQKDIKGGSGSAFSFGELDLSSSGSAVLEEANKIREKNEFEKITPLDILCAIFDQDQDLKSFLLSNDLEKSDLLEIAHWYNHIWSFRQKVKKFWSYENLSRKMPIGISWSYGYAPFLSGFSVNLTDRSKYSQLEDRLITRSKEIERMEEILVRAGKNNVLLVGLDGIGKERLISDFSRLVSQGKALGPLNYKNIFELNLSLVISSAQDLVKAQNVLIEVFNEASASGNAILVLDDIHNFLGAQKDSKEERVGLDISQILGPILRSERVQVIATTDPVSYHKIIESRSEVSSAFERIDLTEPDTLETLKIIEELVPKVESRSGILVTYEAIKVIVSGADKFITSSPFPEKAIDLLSECISFVISSQKKRILTVKDVNEVISRKTGIPQGLADGSEKEKLLDFENLMRKELVGQERAVQVVSSTLRRLRAGLGKKGRPAGVFLFLGPTGVGKTLTAKILAKTYFGSEDKMIRFDMSEFQELDSLNRFLGSLNTNEPGQFVTKVRDNPFSLILLDEIEKANRNILNIFLQVFDEGHLTDVFGRRVSFEQNIIIATSNAGADVVRDMVNRGIDPASQRDKINDVLIGSRYFTPELLNRFDEVVIFHPLSKDQINNIAEILLKSLTQKLSDDGYVFKSNKEITDYLVEIGFDPQFGARPMQRAIRDKLESLIAKKIIEGEIKKGQEFEILAQELKD